MKDQYNIHKKIDSAQQKTIEWIGGLFFGSLPFVTGILAVILFTLIKNDSPFFLKLFFHLNLVIFCGGFAIWWYKAGEHWDEAYVILLRRIYNSKPANKKVTVEIIIPEDLNYNGSIMINFFFFFKNTFRSLDINRANMYNYGKWHSNLAFDMVVHNKETKIYATFPRKKYTQFLEGMVRMFPGVQIVIVDDIYKKWPKEWLEGQRVEGYSDLVGFSMGLKIDGYQPLISSKDIPSVKGSSPVDNMLRSIRDSITDEKVIMQYVFRANGNGLPYAKWGKQYTEWRQRLFDKYSPKTADGKPDSHAFEALLPHEEKEHNEALRWRVNQMLVQSAVRIVALCQKEQVNYMENMLEKIARVYTGNTGSLGDQCVEKKDITATNQKFFRPNNMAPEANYIYDRYIYPLKETSYLTDQFLDGLYNKNYYPKENLYRKKMNYKTLMSRDISAQWNGDNMLLDAVNGAIVFQFPTKAISKTTYQADLITAPSMRLHEDVFNSNED